MTEPATACVVCGTVVQERPLTWSSQVGAQGREWLCDACTRRTVRDVEARLDPGWADAPRARPTAPPGAG